MMEMKIIVIFPNSFPISGAATNRIISICRGLVDEGNEVNILINRPTERKKMQINFKNKGEFKGICFEYVTNTIIWPEKPYLKLYYLILGQVLTILKIFKKHKNNKVDAIISAANYGFLENMIYLIVAKIISVRYVYTVDEYPWVLINPSRYCVIYRKFYVNYFYKLFDGFIVMTNVLMEYFRNVGQKKAKYIHVPMTVELERFSFPKNENVEEYIAYCGGDKDGRKDGTDILLKSFKIVLKKFPKMKLYIIGQIDSSLLTLAEALEIRDNINFCGFIQRDEVVHLLLNAKVLCLARPNNFQALGGFPTKLGEYLATGNPVVVTKVGEIPEYLENNVNAFLAEPGNVEDFASKVINCLSDYNNSIKVGENGKKLALSVFDYKNYSKKLDSFLRALLYLENKI